MLLTASVFSEALYEFPGHFINVVIVGRFNLKVEIRTVIITDRAVALYDIIAMLKEMRYVFVIMLLHQIHRSENVPITEIRLFVVAAKVPVSAQFGCGIEYTCTG